MLGFSILSHGLCLGRKRYSGHFFWLGRQVKGQCRPAKCDGKKLNGKPGQQCRCADGYAGKPSFKSRHSEESSAEAGTLFLHHGEFSDETCTPAECPIPNSKGKGPKCRCEDKFAGNITWKGALVSGECVPAACKFLHSNNKPGPDCACAFGYQETEPVWQPWVQGELFGICEPIPCVGDFSNRQDGPECRCADGYNGTVQLGTI